MAVPKKKKSKMKTRSHRAAAWKLAKPARSVCPRCGQAKTPHTVCPACGWYKNRVAVDDVPLCRPDCPGLCPLCGKDVSVEPCDCDATLVDDRWAVLDQLRDD